MTGFVVHNADWPVHGEILLAIRFAVFVREQGVPPALEHDEHDASALHLLARDNDGRPIGTARMLDDGHIGRMAVLPTWRDRGVGSTLLRELLRVASRRGCERVFLHAQCPAVTFYERLGFTPVGEVFVDAGIDHRQMEKVLAHGHD